MPEVRAHRSGTFCWADLPTTDLDHAIAFYSELFDWRAVDAETPELTIAVVPAHRGLGVGDRLLSALLERVLFGNQRDSFAATEQPQGLFEAATGGTLLLCQIGHLSLPLQARLLRALEGALDESEAAGFAGGGVGREEFRE